MRTLLIANRGEIAVRVARTARAMGIATVAVYSDADRDALHVQAAETAVRIGGVAPADSYLRVDALLDAAARTGADAVHPGYGFLAENAAFARACLDAGLTFVGPRPEVIAAMGDKLAAKRLMADAGVPVLPTYDPASVPPDAYPVIVKAAAGGGGKGMRVVASPAGLAEAIEAARREAAGAFGDDTIFVERYLPRPRHVEVQILGDEHGTLLHVGERECSIQRRHQKVIEEAPSPAVDADLRSRLTQAAIAAGRALGYTSAGTVELVLDDRGRFFFLEVNTRLQVEHPVTELAWALADGTPLDLVRLQLLVARGEPLPLGQDDLRLVRHAIEARLYAEDPANGFLPSTGRLEVWRPHTGPGVRIDAGVAEGTQVGIAYDPLLAKVVAAGPTRIEAAAVLASALARSQFHGVTTNRAHLVDVLRHPAFVAGDLHTGFLDEHLAGWHPPAGRPDALLVAAIALAQARRADRDRPVQRTIPTGWRNNPSQPQRRAYRTEAGEQVAVGYARRRDGTWAVAVDGHDRSATVHAWPDERPDGALDLEVEGLRRQVAVRDVGTAVLATAGEDALVLHPAARFPAATTEAVTGGLLAPMPGTVVRVDADAGQRVAAGQVLVVLEAMKMEHRITAPADGMVTEVRVAAGGTVAAGDVLVVLDGG